MVNEYNKILQSLINKMLLEIILFCILALVVLICVWIAPIIQKHITSKRFKAKVLRRQHDHRKMYQTLLAQIVLTVVCLLSCLPSISQIKDIKAMKTDIENQTYISYNGKYDLNYPVKTSIFDLFLDIRTVTIEGKEDVLFVDMNRVYEGIVPNAGSYNGIVVYAQNSHYIVEIKNTNN